MGRVDVESKDDVLTPKEKFDAMLPIVVNSGEARALGHGDGFHRRVLDWIVKKGILGDYRNTDKGWDIAFNNRSVRNTTGHKAGEGKVALLEHVPDLIKNGIYLKTTVKGDGTTSYIFAVKAIIDGKPSVVGFVVRVVEGGGKRYYDHAIRYEDEGWAEPRTRKSDTTAPEPPETPNSVYNILKEYLGTNTNIGDSAEKVNRNNKKI
jgi:hypothetical protein